MILRFLQIHVHYSIILGSQINDKDSMCMCIMCVSDYSALKKKEILGAGSVCRACDSYSPGCEFKPPLSVKLTQGWQGAGGGGRQVILSCYNLDESWGYYC